MMAVLLEYVTPANISLGVTGMLAFAGALHALPGPTLTMQAKEMGMPAWFIMCAGLLMLGSAAVYWLLPGLGLYAVALCMGGAVATAAKMPNMMHRPGGIVFSNATLCAALWVVYSEAGELSIITLVLCAVFYAMGIAGRLFVPTHSVAIKYLGSLVSVEKKEDPKEAEASEKPKEATQEESTQLTGEAASSGATRPAQMSGARQRVASPVPVRKPASEAMGSS